MIYDAFDAIQAATPSELDRLSVLAEGVDPAVRAELEARAASYEPYAEENPAYQVAGVTFRGSTAIVPIRGYIHKEVTWSSLYGRTTSTAALTVAFRALAADDDVTGVVLQVNSGGGSVRGLELARRELIKLRDVKPVLSLADDVMASAAYYLGSAANAVHVTPSSCVGSIGTIITFQNYAEALKAAGITNVTVRSTKFKNIANQAEPITPIAIEELTRTVTKYHNDFLSALTENLDITLERAQEMADGRTHEGTEAVEAGLASGEASVDELVARLEAQAEALESPDDVTALTTGLTELLSAFKSEVATTRAALASREAEIAAAAETRVQTDLEARVTAAVEAAVADGRVPAAQAGDYVADAKIGESFDAAAADRLEAQLGRLKAGVFLPTEEVEEEVEASAEDGLTEAEREAYAQYPSLRDRLV